MDIITAIRTVTTCAANELSYYEPDEGDDPEYATDALTAIAIVNTWLADKQELAPDWTDPEIPAWTNFIAVDAYGNMSAFADDIEILLHMWHSKTGEWKIIGFKQIPIGIDWRMLKWQRPNK